MPPQAFEHPVQYLDEAVSKDISQRMTRILRHKAEKYGIPIARDAYVKVEHLLRARDLQGITSEEVIAVAESSFKRQEARFELANFEDGVYIRAMKKHSMAQVDFRLLATERASRRLPRAHRTDPAFVPPPPIDPPPPRANDSARQAPTKNAAPVAAMAPLSAWSLLPAPALDPRTATAARATASADMAMPEPLPQNTAAEETAAIAPVFQPPPPPPLGPPPVEVLQGMPSSGPPPLPNARHGKVVENFDGKAWAIQGGYLTLTEGMHITLLPHPEAGQGWAFGRIEGLGGDASSLGEEGWLPEDFFEAC